MVCFCRDDEHSSDSGEVFVEPSVNNKDDVHFLHGVPVSREGIDIFFTSHEMTMSVILDIYFQFCR